MGPESVLRAASLIRTGRVFELGQVLRPSMPLGARHFDLYVKPTGPFAGSNRRGSNEELVVAEMGQVGTQFDGFTHQTIGDSLYNCVDMNEVMTRDGFTRLGVENVGTLMTRGVLIDVAALKGVDMLPDTYEITRRRPRAGPRPPGGGPRAGRRGAHPHRLGRALGQRPRSLHGHQPGHRRRRRRVARRARSHAARRRQPARRGLAQPPIRRSRCPSTR